MPSSSPHKAPPTAARSLLAWYDVHARVLPWRYAKGERADPYRVWLSEIMLQQTTVGTVKTFFQRLTALWPAIEDLADAPVDEVMRAWAGLGYYSRARNLHAAARRVAEDFGGVFPAAEEQLRTLPGVGPYTAAAIAAIAFGRKATPVDGNIERVMARLHAVETPLPIAKAEIKALAEGLTPQKRAGDFAQALMDLGATVCTPKNPACLSCPLMAICEGRRLGIAGTLPRRAGKAARPDRQGAAFVLTADGRVLLRRRPPRGLLGGMLEVPTGPWAAGPPQDPEGHAPVAAAWQRLPERVEHVFTHFRLTLDVYAAEAEACDPGLGLWVPWSEAAAAGLPSVMRKVLAADAVGQGDGRGRRAGRGGGRRGR